MIPIEYRIVMFTMSGLIGGAVGYLLLEMFFSGLGAVDNKEEQN